MGRWVGGWVEEKKGSLVYVGWVGGWVGGRVGGWEGGAYLAEGVKGKETCLFSRE